MNSVPKLFSCSYADCWTEKHFSTEFGVLTSNHTHSHTLFWGCVSRWFGRALAWHARGQRFDPAILHHSVRTRTRFFMKKGSGTFFVYKRFCGGSMQNGKQERVKAGYHHSGVALPFILSICQKSHPINLLFLRSLL